MRPLVAAVGLSTLALLGAPASLAASPPAAPAAMVPVPPPVLTPAPFDIGVVGDWGYAPDEILRLPDIVTAMNNAGLAFAVHDGDFKNGPPQCTDAVYYEARRLFDSFASPLVYTPGDNEWTDCWRSGGDPLNRLAFLRHVFFSDGLSRGQPPMPLERQSAAYPENSRWFLGGVAFATVDVPGSNNDLADLTRPGNPAEHVARTAADQAWITDTFARARARGSRGIVLFQQADPLFELPAGSRYGYDDLLLTLEQETVRFERPVLFVHGDTHKFRVDQPLFTTTIPTQRVTNFTRVETFGPESIAWVRITVDPATPGVFTVQPETLPAPG
jgi:hypothetical protein